MQFGLPAPALSQGVGGRRGVGGAGLLQRGGRFPADRQCGPGGHGRLPVGGCLMHYSYFSIIYFQKNYNHYKNSNFVFILFFSFI